MWYSPRFHQRSEQLMQRESRTSGELLLPVSRRPSHWEMASQRNNEAPSRISNRTSPWWFTRQTVALLLCYWILCHDTAHQDCTVSVQRQWPDQQHQPRTIREPSQAESMSEAVNNKVRPDKDNHLGFTMHWKYQANSVILLRCIESCPTACLLF